MTLTFGILLTTWTVCFALPDVHKQMTISQLQSVFHVDNIVTVPKYELIQLLHQIDDGNQNISPSEVVGHSVRKRRSIINHMEISGKNIHHVKKDLSKSPYYSELKQLTKEQNIKNSISDNSYSEKLRNLDLSDLKEHNVSFSAFGENLNLTLRKTEGLFKNGPNSLRMWTVRSEPNSTQGVEYEEVQDQETSATEESHIGEVYQDENNMAAILMRRHLQTGDLIMEGSIGHELVIKPLPHELSPDKNRVHHVIYKRSVDVNDQLSDFAYMEPDQFEHSYRKRRSSQSSEWTERDDDLIASETVLDNNSAIPSSANINLENNNSSSSRNAETLAESRRNKRSAPYIIYPEILVIVDYDGYRLHGGDNVQVKRYFVSFWNGVDLRYRLLKGPRIRISIAGIIISRGRDATPYLERNRVGRDAIDSAAALTDMGKYLFRERRLPVYDIAVAITKLDMCRRNYDYGECKRGTAGFAYVGGACVVNKRLEKVNSVAIIEDTGGFSGIIVAAHEVGHLLGAVHDGSPPPSYLGGPGAERCRWEDGYIMSDLRHTERGFRWSPCTIQSFHHFLNGDTASCLHNAPHEDGALGRSLPGTLLSLDAQCRRDRGTYACFKDDRVCAQLFCFDSQTGYCVAYRPAAEGSSCGNGVYCLDGRCVAQQANTIPDYSSQFAYRTFKYNSHNNNDDEKLNDDNDDDDDDDDDEDDDDEDSNNENINNNNNKINNRNNDQIDLQNLSTIRPQLLTSYSTTSSLITIPYITSTARTLTSTKTTTGTEIPFRISYSPETENYPDSKFDIPILNKIPIINQQTTLSDHDVIKTETTTTNKPTATLITKRPLQTINPLYYGYSKLFNKSSHLNTSNNDTTTTLQNHTITTLLNNNHSYNYNNHYTINKNNRTTNNLKSLSLKPIRLRKPFDYYLNLYNIKNRNSHNNGNYYSTSTTSSSSIQTSPIQTTTPITTSLIATTTINSDDYNSEYNIPTPKYGKLTKLIRKQQYEKYNYETDNNNGDNINQNNKNQNDDINDNSDDIIDSERILDLKKEIQLNDDNINNNSTNGSNNNNNGHNNSNNNNQLNHNSHHITQPTHRSYIFGGRSTTRSLYFDQYFRKLTTTTKPPTYYIESIGQYFKRTSISSSTSSSSSSNNSNNNNNINNNNNDSNNNNNDHRAQNQEQQNDQQKQQKITDLHVVPATQPPHSSISTNYLGDNTNNLPVNISVPNRRVE